MLRTTAECALLGQCIKYLNEYYYYKIVNGSHTHAQLYSRKTPARKCNKDGLIKTVTRNREKRPQKTNHSPLIYSPGILA